MSFFSVNHDYTKYVPEVVCVKSNFILSNFPSLSFSPLNLEGGRYRALKG